MPSPYSEGDAVAFVTEIAPTEWAADTGAPFAISGAATGRLLGSIGVHRVDRRHGSAEVGYWVAAPARARGVATEAARAPMPRSMVGWRPTATRTECRPGAQPDGHSEEAVGVPGQHEAMAGVGVQVISSSFSRTA